MVELYPVGQISDNHVYPGVLHNAFMDVGIPSFTLGISAARVLDPEMIPRPFARSASPTELIGDGRAPAIL